MARNTGIQWADDTDNPVEGCDGCEIWQAETKAGARRSCYAGLLHQRADGSNPGFAPRFEQVTLFPGRMAKAAKRPSLRGLRRRDKPWLDSMPRIVFVSDMGDALSKSVSFEYLHTEIVDVAESAEGRRHIWMWLTKQPKRVREFSQYVGAGRWPPNLWVGTSITEPRYVDRIAFLRDVGDEHTVRFLSVEPQHTPISLAGRLEGIALVIQGGESGPTTQGKLSLPLYNQQRARPFDLAWARSLRDECARANVAYFLKQLGSAPVVDGAPVKLRDKHGGNWDEWPDDLRVREMPQTWRLNSNISTLAGQHVQAPRSDTKPGREINQIEHAPEAPSSKEEQQRAVREITGRIAGRLLRT